MDSRFHKLSRKELQALCKKNKIPANITNVAMADALVALEMVQGLDDDDLMNQSESPLLKIQTQSKDLHQTPALEQSGRTRVQGSCRRRKNETQTKEVYGTRRSMRLLEKTMADLSIVKADANIMAGDDMDDTSHGSDSQMMMMAQVGLQRNLSESLDKEGLNIEQVKEKENNTDYGAEDAHGIGETDATLDIIPTDLDLNQKTCGLTDANLETLDESGSLSEAITQATYNSTWDLVVDAKGNTDSCAEDDSSSEVALNDVSSENANPIHQEFETKEDQDAAHLPLKPDEETTEAKDSFGNGQEAQVTTVEQMSQGPSLVVLTTNTFQYQFPRPLDKSLGNNNQTTLQETIQVSDMIEDNNDALHITREAHQKTYEDMSIRQIKKKLKELALTKNNKNQDKKQVDKARAALQPLPDNCERAQENEK